MALVGGMFGLIAMIAVVVVLFLVFRKVALWYWKIDKIEEHLAAIRKNLEKK